MFNLGFTKHDIMRAVWSFIGGVAAYVVVTGGDMPSDWKAFASGAVVAGLVSVKNLVLKDGTALKG